MARARRRDRLTGDGDAWSAGTDLKGYFREVGRAVVVRSPGAGVDPDALVAFLRERLAGYRVPRSVVFAEHLPRTPSGKLRKNEIAATHGETHGEQSGARRA